MPVNVHIPVRVRLDGEALDGRDDDVSAAVEAAVTRALDHSHRQVLAPRDHYPAVRLRDPAFAWSGRGLEQATPYQRQRIEALVGEAIAKAAASSKVAAYQRAKSKAVTPLFSRAQERFDPRRRHPLGYYVLPSYDDKGKTTAVQVEPEEPPQDVVTWSWEPQPADWFVRLSLFDRGRALKLALGPWGMDHLVLKNYCGVIWFQPSSKLSVGIAIATPEADLITYEVPLFQMHRVVTIENKTYIQPETGLPDPQLFTAEWWTAEAISRDYRSWLVAKLADIRGPELDDQQASAAKMAQFVDESVERFMRGFSTDGLVISWSGGKVSLRMEADVVRFTGIAYLGPKAQSAFNFEPIEFAEPSETGLGGTKPKIAEGRSGSGAGARKGGYIDAGEGGQDGEFAFPRPSTAIGVALVCESFDGEPALEDLPDDLAQDLRKLIDDIASRLAIEPCRFAGHFCITAAWVLGERARTVSEVAAEMSSGMLEPPKHKAVPGVLDFRPTASPAIQYLRHLADLVSRVTHLARRIDGIYRENARRIKGLRENNHIGWMLGFGSTLNSALVHSVKDHFVSSTRTVFLQLLHTSKLNIDARLNPAIFENYARFFEQLVRNDLLPEGELQQLKARLAVKTQSAGKVAAGVALDIWRDIPHSWREVRNGIFDVIANSDPFVLDLSGAAAGAPVLGPDGKWRIKDTQGRLWTMDQLERAIAVRRDTATQIDPLMQQLMSDPKLKQRFTSQPTRIREELELLLKDMADANRSVTEHVSDDEHYAFGMAPIDDEYNKDKPQTIAGTGFVLQGVHLLTHQTMQEFFRGDVYYTLGVRLAMNEEDTKRWLKEAVFFAIPLALAVICAPLGIIAGVAFAVEARIEAGEKMEAYHALINPDAVFEYAQLEAELFAADIGVALSFIPVPGMGRTAGKIGARAAAALVKGEIRAAAGIVTRSVFRVLTKATLKAVRDGIVKAFIHQILVGEVMSRTLNYMITPVVEQMQREHLSYEQLVALAAEVQEG